MTPRVNRYVYEAAQRHGVDAAAVHGRNRHKRVSFARFEVMRRLRADGHSITAIAQFIDRDRSTVSHGLTVAAPGLWFA